MSTGTDLFPRNIYIFELISELGHNVNRVLIQIHTFRPTFSISCYISFLPNIAKIKGRVDSLLNQLTSQHNTHTCVDRLVEFELCIYFDARFRLASE